MMPRIADVLERESRTVDLEQGDFERLLGRRERKQRNRQIRAGAVGVIVALAMGIALVRSLTSDGIPADPPVEPRPAPAALGSLAYTLDGDVYVADPDGSNAVKIADGRPASDCHGIGEYWAEGPIWSPDGRYLAYRYSDCSSAAFGRGGVVISDSEGKVFAKFPTGGGWDIGWSPDSTRVAVWDSIGDPVASGGYPIGVYGLDGARQTQLTVPLGMHPGGEHDPMWLPDGEALMFPWSDVVVPIDGSTPYHLELADLPTGGLVTYSLDGSLVAYVTSRPSLMVAGSDGSEPRKVFGDWAGFLTWSPTGDRIAFTATGPGASSYSTELRILDVVTGTATLLAESDESETLSVIDFSPQGDRIMFSRSDDRGGRSSLWSINAEGSDLRRLVAGTASGDWSSPRAD
jgi:Tol biopolymer transport system component